MLISTDGDGRLSGSVIAGIVTGAVVLFSIVIILAIIIFKKVILTRPMYVSLIMNTCASMTSCIHNYIHRHDGEQVDSTMVSMSSSLQSSQPQGINCMSLQICILCEVYN